MLLLLLLWVITVIANPVNVYFNSPLTHAFLSDLEDFLQYRCTEYIGKYGLLLYIPQSMMQPFLERFHEYISIIEPTEPVELCSSRVGTASPSLTYTENRKLLNTTSLQLHNAARTFEKEQVQELRFLIHLGAMQYVGDIDYILHMLQERYVRFCSRHRSVFSTCSPDAVHIHSLTILHIHDVPVTLAEKLVGYVLTDDINPFCWIEPVIQPILTNVWSAASAQRTLNRISHDNQNAALQCIGGEKCSPFWHHGLRGRNELITIADTGVNEDTCFFVDPNRNVPYTSTSSIPPDNNHRVIRAYWTFGDNADHDGHGTHVCGTALGDSLSGSHGGNTQLDPADFNGIASDARLVFIDIQQGSGALRLPTPIDSNMLQFAYNSGSRIFSGSFGIPHYSYSVEDYQVDDFCWHHRDMVIMFAAGNSGSSGHSTILTPALAKNSIAVGATMNGYSAASLAASSSPSEPVEAYNFTWVTHFSSRGGDSLGVTWRKPDCVANGGENVWSASYTDTNQCASINSAVLGIAGTSTSAPVVGGSVAIIRQYFLEAIYNSIRIEPMASLVKAIITASSVPTKGIFPQMPYSSLSFGSHYQPYEKGFIEGSGHISLDRALPLPSTTTSLLVISNENEEFTFTQSHQEFMFDVRIEGNGVIDMCVVMHYTDFPQSLSVPEKSLTNNIDMELNLNGQVYTLHDDNSPWEYVCVKHVFADITLKIIVRAAEINFQSQDFSLIVTTTGSATTILLSDEEFTTTEEEMTTTAETESSTTTATTPLPTPLPTSFTIVTPQPTPSTPPVSSSHHQVLSIIVCFICVVVNIH